MLILFFFSDCNSIVSAVDIVRALNSIEFNKYELRLIEEAYNKLMKNQTRKRIEKRRKLNLYLKGHRRIPGDDDSGEQGSNSSNSDVSSSDDCRYARTFYNSNQNILALNNTNVTREKHDTSNNMVHQNQKCNSVVHKTAHKNIPNTTLKKHLPKGTNSCLPPLQRFNKSVHSHDTQTFINQKKDTQNGDLNYKINQQNIATDRKKAEITISDDLQDGQQKRFPEHSEAVCFDKKIYKATTSPIKQNNVTNLTQNDFHSKRPQRRARKLAINKMEEIPDTIHLDLPQKASDNRDQTHNVNPVNSTATDDSSNQTEISQNTTDVSMRPSFFKRNVFTQKLDVAGNNNLSSDDVGTNRPQTKLCSGLREKNENVKNPVDLIKNNKPKRVTPCKVTGQTLPKAKSKENQREIEANKSNCPNKKTVSSMVKSFWDSDFDSDMEETIVTPWKSSTWVVAKEIEKDTICNNTVSNVVNKKNNTRGMILTTPCLQKKIINNTMRSDENKTRKKTIIQENKDYNIIAKNSESNKESQANKNLDTDAKNQKYKPMKKDSESELEKENLKPKSVQTKTKATKKEQQTDDPLKLNKRKTRNKKGNKKNNYNNTTMASPVKKNNTIEQTPKKKRQIRYLFASPDTDSSFISF